MQGQSIEQAPSMAQKLKNFKESELTFQILKQVELEKANSF